MVSPLTDEHIRRVVRDGGHAGAIIALADGLEVEDYVDVADALALVLVGLCGRFRLADETLEFLLAALRWLYIQHSKELDAAVVNRMGGAL